MAKPKVAEDTSDMVGKIRTLIRQLPASLAKRFGVSVQALRDANGLSAGDALRAGVTLRIPG